MEKTYNRRSRDNVTNLPYHTLLERRVHALNRNTDVTIELRELPEGVTARVVLKGKAMISPTLKWAELYWWLDGWLTARDISLS